MSGGLSSGVSIGPGGVSVSAAINLPRPSSVPGLFIPNNRSIGPIHAQVTIEEQERDELTITEFPVEQGAPVSDHAYKRPSEVTIRAGWTKAMSGDLSANGGGVYARLLQWQAALVPFNLVTGKRTYSSMLIQSLMVTTDSRSEYALMAEIHCKQVIIVATQTTQASVSQDPSKQADPAKTSTPSDKSDQPTKDVGSGQPKPGSIDPLTGNVVGEQFGPPAPAGPPEQVIEGAPISPEGAQVEKTVNNNTTPEQLQQKGVDTTAPFVGAIN